MIVGKTHQEKIMAEMAARARDIINPENSYAYLPTQLEDGRWVWLELSLSKEI